MTKNYFIYADIFCLCRPLDDLEQSRIKLEAEAIMSILENCEQKKWALVNSDAIQFEIAKNVNYKKEKLEKLLYHVRIISYKKTFSFSSSFFPPELQNC
ncbi:MAG: hypothetical protein SWX82_03790 [Cyanobacteriota bacterium]|nr:hypothetical protein [Cyanobacteriota bacterium]